MSDIEEAERRLAAAKEELRAAELAHRQVVPCQHPSMVITSGDPQFRCGDCHADLPDPRGCQHQHIDNDTERCSSCGEKMVQSHRHERRVLTAPNKAACTRPDCGGTDDPNCENPSGLYIPDVSQQREVVIQVDWTYDCSRCRHDGDIFVSGEEPIWSCGRDHRGGSVPVREGVPA